MPRIQYPAPRLSIRLLSIAFAYSLILSSGVPVLPRRVMAAAAPVRAKTIATATAAQNPPLNRQREGEALVRFRFGVTEDEKNAAVAAAQGARRGRSLRGASRFERLELTGGQTPQTLARRLAEHPSVAWVEPNFLISRDDLTPRQSANQIPGYLPSLPRNTEPWARGALMVGGSPGQMGTGPGAPNPWEPAAGATAAPPQTGTGGMLLVAVVDSGVDFTHPDLAAGQWTNPSERANDRDDDRDGYTDDLHGWDWVAGDNQIRDEQGHGTSVAGLIVAEVDRAAAAGATSSVVRRASLMSLRVLDNTGTGDVAAAVEAIDYAVAHGAQVINLSWGLETGSLALREAIERASQRGVVVVCSAGNNGRDIDGAPYYPAAYGLPNLIAAAASDSADNLASWSNWGATRVTVAAPGVDVSTTKLGGGHHEVTGTSAAAPQVSGIAGLVRSTYPGLSAADTRASIVSGARQVAGLNGKVAAGGVAQAAGALSAAGGMGAGAGGGNGGGGGNNGGGNNGGGSGGGQPGGGSNGPGRGQSPQPGSPGHGSGGRGRGGSFDVAPPEVTRGAPPNLPNLDEVRKLKNTEPKAPTSSSTISANLLCADCDPNGGGGGGYEPPGDARYSTARTEPRNETGQAGVDLGSRNFNWSTPLVGLTGRAGLDFGLALSYNSLVWTKQGYGIKFNADRGFPGPGFRLGFPTIQQRYYNSQVGVYSYMMVTPGGGRVELRQVGGSNVYEAQDSSYTQMIDNGNGTALVRTTDGTRLSFGTVNGEMRCSQIKDRNGNYITVNYDGYGHVDWVVDTLGRIIDFHYNGDGNLTSITQPWNGGTHTWATFSYGSLYLQGNFPGIYVNGPNYSNITVLTQVGLQDGSYYTFQYTSWGQVYRINHHAADGHQRNYTSYNLPQDSSAGQSDCPRFTERRDWAEEWNGGAEAVTSYGVAGDGSWSQVTTPDGTLYKEFFATTGWQTGLTTLSEVWSGGAKKKWTTIGYNQDAELPYQKNPRVVETNVYDEAGNRRRTTIAYTSYGLPSDVYEYAADASSVLRRTHTDYRFDAAYIDLRIIGLVHASYLYDGAGSLLSLVDYNYDSGGEFLQAQGSPGQHDPAYNTNFVVGRGNLIQARRWDKDYPSDVSRSVSTWTGYNTDGSVIFRRDALGHQTSINYGDNFSDGVNRNTFAYPTMVTDADGFSSSAQYNFDIGAVTRTQGPPPAGQTQGAIQTMQYDAAGRILRVTNENNSAYTRWYYPSSQNYVQSYSTLESLQSESYSITYFDGGGRPRASAQAHPGSTGGYTATLTAYDAMGRAVQGTKPTEIYPSWAPAGDDAAGWVWTYQQYDWQGRPTLTTLPYGNTVENIYGGCGCAGGEVTTTRDERGRRKRYTKDVLGRLAKAEELNWDQSVYATTQYAYNARDQLTGINQAGQGRSFGYDGHGRLNSRTTPEQGTTTYGYFPDDTTRTVTDARSVTTTFAYNNRDLVTGINYSIPEQSNVAATANVTYSYDAAGNRTGMTDGLGSVSYGYDQLSRLTSETRTFNGVAGPNAGSFRLAYQYNLAGQLAQVMNPWDAQAGYQHDAEGRVTSVSGAGYVGVASYASGLQYSAFGGLKGMTYSNGRTLALSYDARMRLTTWNVAGVLGWNYSYDKFAEKSHRVTYAQNLYDATLDRSYDYDHVGRLQYTHTGVEARSVVGEPTAGVGYGPYSQHVYYDVWGNITQRQGWGGWNATDSATFTDNRRNGLQYDLAGNMTADGGQIFQYDATGQQVSSQWVINVQHAYDGDGLRGRKTEDGVVTYALRSSVLGGQVVAEMNGSGQWQRGYVYLGGQLLALQQESAVEWVHQDPVTKSQRLTNSAQAVTSVVDLDPWGGETDRSSSQGRQPQRFTTYQRDANYMDEAMARRYHAWWSRFSQPDPYDGSYNLSDPQSLNRYSYVQNDPVNFVDPTGLDLEPEYVTVIGTLDDYIWQALGSLILGRRELDARIGGGGGGGEIGGGGSGGGETTPQQTTTQNPYPPPPANCEAQLAKLFGDPNGKPGARMSLTTDISTGGYRGYDPKVPASANPDMQHLFFFPHLSSPSGNERTAVYVPGDFQYIGRMTLVAANGPIRMFYSQQRDATVFITHLADFKVTGAGDRFRVGNTGGKGGAGAGNLHVHFAAHTGRGFNPSNRVPFSTIFCK